MDVQPSDVDFRFSPLSNHFHYSSKPKDVSSPLGFWSEHRLMDGTEHEIPLGSFSIAHKPLHLQLDATIAVFVRQRSTVPYANNLDSTPDINDLLTAWVCRAAGLRLTLQTDGHGCPEYNGLSDDERVDLWAAICQQICNAEVSTLQSIRMCLELTYR